MAHGFGKGDWAVAALIGFLIVLKGLWWSLPGKNPPTTEEFFLAGRSMSWLVVALSLFASNIGTEHFVGQGGSGAARGLAVGMYEWSAGWPIFLLGWVFAPMYLRMQLTTIPEWFEKRYNIHCRVFLTIVQIFVYAVTKIASALFAGAILFDVVLGVSMWTSVPVILIFTGLYSTVGGLPAVMMTDAFQAIILITGGVIGACVAFNRIGGMSGLEQSLDRVDKAEFMNVLKPHDDDSYPWTGMFTGMPLSSIWYWCIDQQMVQRVLAARSLKHAQAGAAVAGFLKIATPFMIVFPGMIARVLYEQCIRGEQRSFDDGWCETRLNDDAETNKAYPYLILKEFPEGVLGMVVASMCVAMMSSLDSTFNSMATIVTCDVYKRVITPDATGRQMVRCGRFVTILGVLLGIIWLPILEGNSSQLYLTVQSVMSHMAPTLVAIFLLGVFWTRTSPTGATIGLFSGIIFGFFRLVVSMRNEEYCDGLPRREAAGSFYCMNFNNMAALLFLASAAITIVGSLLSEPPHPSQLVGTTYWSYAAGDTDAVDAADAKRAPNDDDQIALPQDYVAFTSPRRYTNLQTPHINHWIGETSQAPHISQWLGETSQDRSSAAREDCMLDAGGVKNKTPDRSDNPRSTGEEAVAMTRAERTVSWCCGILLFAVMTFLIFWYNQASESLPSSRILCQRDPDCMTPTVSLTP